MVGARTPLWAVVALAAACGSFPNPKAKTDPNADAGVDDAFVGFDADPPDAFAYLDGGTDATARKRCAGAYDLQCRDRRVV